MKGLYQVRGRGAAVEVGLPVSCTSTGVCTARQSSADSCRHLSVRLPYMRICRGTTTPCPMAAHLPKLLTLVLLALLALKLTAALAQPGTQRSCNLLHNLHC